MEWISVKDRLPNEYEAVLAYRESDDWFIICDFQIGNFVFIEIDDIVQVAHEISHWMPLPKLPIDKAMKGE